MEGGAKKHLTGGYVSDMHDALDALKCPAEDGAFERRNSLILVRVKGAAKASCRETVSSKRVFLESPFLLCPLKVCS